MDYPHILAPIFEPTLPSPSRLQSLIPVLSALGPEQVQEVRTPLKRLITSVINNTAYAAVLKNIVVTLGQQGPWTYELTDWLERLAPSPLANDLIYPYLLLSDLDPIHAPSNRLELSYALFTYIQRSRAYWRPSAPPPLKPSAPHALLASLLWPQEAQLEALGRSVAENIFLSPQGLVLPKISKGMHMQPYASLIRYLPEHHQEFLDKFFSLPPSAQHAALPTPINPHSGYYSALIFLYDYSQEYQAHILQLLLQHFGIPYLSSALLEMSPQFREDLLTHLLESHSRFGPSDTDLLRAILHCPPQLADAFLLNVPLPEHAWFWDSIVHNRLEHPEPISRALKAHLLVACPSEYRSVLFARLVSAQQSITLGI